MEPPPAVGSYQVGTTMYGSCKAGTRLVGYMTSIHASFGNTHLKTTHPEVFLTSCQGILFRQHACPSSMLTEKSSTTFPVLLSWHPKQINNCA